ncbi:hypothetical protein O3M35_003735 [Rhynocoris fuscipes]|uniref:Uncharacterized protein n=1 Tax=Rhynocoris fuscipes TaxID=488301 RepID=A0AAW1CK35_9HEMI
MECGEEIISLQFGSFANFVGAHYFNIQEAGFSYNPDFIPDIHPDRLFRTSKDKFGNYSDYTPRTVLVDDEINNSFVESCAENNVGETWENVSGQSENLETLPDLSAEQSQEIRNILFKSKNLKENLTNWTDFTNIPFHPKSFTYTSKEYGLSSPESTYYLGTCCAENISFWDRFEDNIRFFAEECDSLQGFQIISEGNSAYSAIASATLHYLRDEYVKKARILTPAYFIPENASYYQKQVHVCNSLSLLAEVSNNVDIIIPISMHQNPWNIKEPIRNVTLRNVNYQVFDKYENSAVLAAGFELITLAYRKRDELNISMKDYCEINLVGRCISNAGILIPFPTLEIHNLPNILKHWNGSFFNCISPFASSNYYSSVDIMYLYSKGILSKKSFDPTRNLMVEQSNEELLQHLNTFIQSTYSAKMMKHFSSSSKFRVPLTFPNVFDNNYNLVNQDFGKIGEFYGIGCLMNSNEIKNNLELLSSTALMNYRKLRLTTEQAAEIDFNSLIESLNCLASNYCDQHEL